MPRPEIRFTQFLINTHRLFTILSLLYNNLSGFFIYTCNSKYFSQIITGRHCIGIFVVCNPNSIIRFHHTIKHEIKHKYLLHLIFKIAETMQN